MNRPREQERRTLEGGCAVGLDSTQSLSLMRRGNVGRILAVQSSDGNQEVERGLLEMGFVEGARVEMLHYGWLGRDPLAVRINQTMTIALRRCEANAVLVGPLHDVAVESEPMMTLEYASS